MGYLPTKEILSLAPEEPGVVRINHTTASCSGTSKSLKITRLNDGSIHAHCFRCGDYCFIDNNPTRGSKIKKALRYADENTNRASTHDSKSFFRDVEYNRNKWPQRAKEWVEGFEISESELKRSGISYKTSKRRLILPLWGEKGIVRIQSRRIFNDDPDPVKTRTKVFEREIWWHINTGDGGPNKTEGIVLVEDIISAIKVSRITNAYPLTSSNIPIGSLAYIVKNFEEFYIWLDNDNIEVIKNAKRIENMLLLVTDNVFRIEKYRDPKYYSTEGIKEILENV